MNLARLWKAIVAALIDARDNKPLPSLPTELAGSSVTLVEAVDELARVLPALLAAVRMHRGYLTGAAEILDELRRQGVEGLEGPESAIFSLEKTLNTVQGRIGEIRWAVHMFQPAAIGIPGGISGAPGRIL